jgi:DNA-binding IclR family transcriptional regulator
MTRRPARFVEAERGARLPTRGRPRSAGRAPVGIQAVDMGLEILDRIVANGAGMSLSALSRETGLKPNLLHRYLVSLTRRSLLTQAPLTGLYDLGPYARRIGLVALNRFEEMAHVHQFVTTFVAQTGHTIALYVWTDIGPTLIRMEMASGALPFALRVGSALPLCRSATGRVFLAYLPDGLTRSFVERERAVAAAEGWTLPDLGAEVAKIRSERVYATRDAIIPSRAIVAPILDASGKLFCTLTGLAPLGSATKDWERLSADLQRGASTLSLELFGSSGPVSPALTRAPAHQDET